MHHLSPYRLRHGPPAGTGRALLAGSFHRPGPLAWGPRVAQPRHREDPAKVPVPARPSARPARPPSRRGRRLPAATQSVSAAKRRTSPPCRWPAGSNPGPFGPGSSVAFRHRQHRHRQRCCEELRYGPLLHVPLLRCLCRLNWRCAGPARSPGPHRASRSPGRCSCRRSSGTGPRDRPRAWSAGGRSQA